MQEAATGSRRGEPAESRPESRPESHPESHPEPGPLQTALRNVARLAARMLDAPAGMLRAVDRAGGPAASAFGLESGEAGIATAFCARTAHQRDALALHGPPAEDRTSRIRFRAGVPVVAPDGTVLGALAVMDHRSRPDPGAAQIEALRDLAAIAAATLDAREPGAAPTEWPAFWNRLKSLAVEAPGYEAAVLATTQAVCEATGGLLCTLHRLGAEGRSLHLVGGSAAPALGGPALVEAIRRAALPADAPLLGAAVAQGRQQVARDAGPGDPARHRLIGPAAPGPLTLFATPLRLAEERCVLLLACEAPDPGLPELLRDAAAALRPLLQMLRDKERALLHRRVVEASSEAVLITEATPDETRIVYVNPAFEGLTGFPAAELVGATPRLLEGLDAPGEGWRAIREAVRLGTAIRREVMYRHKNGAPVWVDLHISPVADSTGRCSHFVSMVRDVTRERQAAQRLAESEVAFRNLFERNPIPMWIYDQETLAFLSVNDAAVADYGWSREQFLGLTILDIRPEEDRAATRAMAARPRRDRTISGPWRHLTADGREKQVQISSHLTGFAGRRAVLAAAWDVTARLRFEEALRLSRAELQRQAVELRQTQRLARLGTWRWRADGSEVAWSEELAAILGPAPGGTPPARTATRAAILALVHPQDREGVKAAIAGIAASGQPAAFEFRIRRADGRLVHCRSEGHFEPDPEGGPGSVHGYVQDVTEQREAEAALRQAERLNSLGQLTGGIAHDFNNLLTVALVSLEMAAEASREGRATPELIDSARSALERGMRLTSQLLSYARRQPLRPETLDLGRVLPGLLELMQRSIGQTYPIRLDLGGTEPVSADPGQLEAALLNLLLNARDAMPGGGPIVVEAGLATIGRGAAAAGGELGAELAPGRYATIAVADRGMGMPPEVKARIFEPFFTTKAPGRGTGLGLSMVLGFAKQSGGHVCVQSEPGQGTAVKLYLPVVESGTEAVRAEEGAAPLPERLDVLVVEDQADVRGAAVRLCKQVGLEPFAVGSAPDALGAFGSGMRFDVLFTDVVLGGEMDGIELAAAAQRLQPGIAVICTSGFTDAHSGEAASLPPGVEFLNKPYDIRRFRAALGRALAAARA